MSEVPDHLIDAAARAIKATMVSESSFASVTEEARAAILAVADELRAEGARAERERWDPQIARALGICEDAGGMTCECDGYYQCNGCERRIADRADDAVEVLRDLLAAIREEYPNAS